MKKGIKGAMNIDFSEHYDEEDDIYYVTFKTGEPSFVVEVDDIILLETGFFTGAPTGFRILNYSKHNIGGIEFHIKKVERAVAAMNKEIPALLADRSARLTSALNRTLVAA